MGSAIKSGRIAVAGIACAIPLLVLGCMSSQPESPSPGYDIAWTGLVPVYPDGYHCSPLTSLYASWIDVDGSKRDEAHSGVDGGRYGEDVLAPADGTVVAAWQADWGWGPEGSLLILHGPRDANLDGDGPSYYSAFDHLNYDEVARYRKGERVSRGQKLATVSRPGGQSRYLPEVHWEVWELSDTDDRLLVWGVNEEGKPSWTNSAARLVDPLYLLSLQDRPKDLGVPIRPNDAGEAARRPMGFSYILPCSKRGTPVTG